MKKRFLALLLCAALGCSALPFSAAAAIDSPEAYAADLLGQLGLLHGVGKKADGSPDYDLLGIPSREVAVTMLVRLLGKEEAAKSGSWTLPFADISDWAKPYVGYAYANQLTYGTSETSFGGAQPVTAGQYLTFVLRALGYRSDSDFEVGAPWDLADALGMTYGEYDASSINFNRGDVAVISAAALGTQRKEGSGNLLMFLKESGVLAPNRLVLLDLSVVACQQNTMSFALSALGGSPNTYSSFSLESVTVNGLPAKISQYKTAKESVAANAKLSGKYPDLISYCLLSYDEKLVKEAAEHHTDLGGGNVFPVLVFRFEGTGTLADGTTVAESFSEAVYIDGYGENA